MWLLELFGAECLNSGALTITLWDAAYAIPGATLPPWAVTQQLPVDTPLSGAYGTAGEAAPR